MAEGQPQTRWCLPLQFLHASVVSLPMIIVAVSLVLAVSTKPYKSCHIGAQKAVLASNRHTRNVTDLLLSESPNSG